MLCGIRLILQALLNLLREEVVEVLPVEVELLEEVVLIILVTAGTELLEGIPIGVILFLVVLPTQTEDQ